MSIYRKTTIIYFCFLIPAIIVIMLFSLQTENPLRTYLIIAGSLVLGDILFFKMKTRIYRYFYKKYMNIIEEELNPEKFISLTENEYNGVKNKKYRNYMKMNLFLGYFNKGNMEKAYDCLMNVETSGVSGIAKADKIIYYHNLILLLYNLDRKSEAEEMFIEYKEAYNDELKYKNKRKETKKFIEYLELLLFHEDKNSEIIKILEETLELELSKRIELSLKYDIAYFNQKVGNIEKAEKFYKEVTERGNKLFIVEKAKKELEKII